MPDSVHKLPPPRRGRPFPKGNPGRRRGSLNKTTLLAQALLQGQQLELVEKATEMAKGGNSLIMKNLLDRILPKGRPLPIKLPRISNVTDARLALQEILDALGTGQISCGEAAALTGLVTDFLKAFDIADIQERLMKLEEERHGPGT